MPTPRQTDGMHGGEGSVPVPDPTLLTTQQLIREISALRAMLEARVEAIERVNEMGREIIETRIHGMDEAINLVRAAADRMPQHVDEKLRAVQNVLQERFSTTDEKFAGISLQFDERDKRGERESRDNKVAVDAAFAAQKEAAAKQDESNGKAIEKSEKATQETIKTNAELNRAEIKAVIQQIDDIKERVTRIEARDEGGSRKVVESQASGNYAVGIISAIIAVVAVAVAIAALLKH